MATLPFHTLDVFTRTPYAGNPLAVVLDADGLNAVQMQQLAREFNLSETVFVQEPLQGGDVKLRIFTPTVELPFAGHPTVGTAALLARLDLLGGKSEVRLEENVGLVPVRLRREGDDHWFAELSSAIAPELREPDYDTAALPGVLGLEPSAIRRVQLASCGNPVSLVYLGQPEHLNAIGFDAPACRALLANSWTHGLYVVAEGYEGEWQARFFAPDLGVAEDPATGSAAVAFAGALGLADRRIDVEQTVDIVQGVAMGRPSQLLARYVRRDGALRSVHVGGHAVAISSGAILVP